MSQESYTDVTNQSWFSRIGGAIKGVLIGLLLIIIAFILLFWNEGRSVERYKTLKEGRGAVVSIKPDAVSPNNEGKLVHVSGKADTEDTVTDPVFEISKKALKLVRNVEMYQWKETTHKETKKKLGGGKKTVTTYTYGREWSTKIINSSHFKHPDGHRNPTAMPYKSETFFAGKVTLGAFTLPREMVNRIGGGEPLSITPGDVPLPISALAQAYNGEFFVGGNPEAPEVGDARVSFTVVSPTNVSVIARQVDNTFEPYDTKAGGSIDLMQNGIHSADAMFKSEQQSNKILTWILRLVGFVLMFIGFSMIFSPLAVVADVVPLLGSIVGAGTGIISFLISLVLSLLTIAIAWIFYRPVLGVSLLVIVIVLIVLTRGKLKKSAKPATQSAG
ncbi:MAG: hypothetical protein GXO70_07890 [Acidobacteria bacterium]|nr:hypothetical protein [Acidobacteriota bacterium]